MAGKSPEELQRAVEIYQQELSKLQQKMAAAKQEEDEGKDTKRPLGPLGLPPPPPALPHPPPTSKSEERPTLPPSPAMLAAKPPPPPVPAAPSIDASPLQGSNLVVSPVSQYTGWT